LMMMMMVMLASSVHSLLLDEIALSYS